MTKPIDTSLPNKPSPLPVAPENIPESLRFFPQWVLWRYELRGDKWTKPPYMVNGNKADKTNTDHWTDFSEVIAAYEDEGFDGIGFVLTKGDPFVAIDLDHCIHPNGIINNFAMRIITKMNSYTEYSPSGEGIRIFAKGSIPRNRKNKLIEIYDHAWYLTVTGQQL